MANVDSPFGLKPVMYANGAVYNGAKTPYLLTSGFGTAMFVGDPVYHFGTSNTARVKFPGMGTFEIGTLPEVRKSALGDSDSQATRVVTGVIVGFSANPDGLETNYNPANTERGVWVCDDPMVWFEIQANGAVPAASINLNAILIQDHSGSTITGLSGIELDTTGTAPGANASYTLRIARHVNRPDNETNAIWNKLLVRISAHTESQGFNAVGDGLLGS